MQKSFDVIVVGAGASGIMAAGRAAERGFSVLLLEKMSRPGLKLLITAKGRCNFTNSARRSDFIKHIHPNGRFLKPTFSKFFSSELIQFFADNGLLAKEEDCGRIFPETEKSKDVLDVLLSYAKKNGVEFSYNSKVEALRFSENSEYIIDFQKDEEQKRVGAKSVIIATGGKSYPLTGSEGDGYKLASDLGHTIVEPKPALVPIVTKGEQAKKLQGVALQNVEAQLWIDGKKIKSQIGEMIFTHFGLSGPIILALSRFAVDAVQKKQDVKIVIDINPDCDLQSLDASIVKVLNENGKKKFVNILPQWMPTKMVDFVINETAIDREKLAHQINAKERKLLSKMMKNLSFDVFGNRAFKDAMITAGGVATSEISAKTMESKICKNLFFAGELLDLDADTGGFNLQIAFSTGWVAGDSCC